METPASETQKRKAFAKHFGKYWSQMLICGYLLSGIAVLNPWGKLDVDTIRVLAWMGSTLMIFSAYSTSDTTL
jgi:hypothetical protein